MPGVWRCGRFSLSLDRPLVMGIVNTTPDSFSDGGRFADADAAIGHGMRLLAEGADIIDVGGESTRPGAGEVGVAEETRRTVPVIEALAARELGPISVDTRHAAVAATALVAGASVVNDVAGFRDAAMLEVAADSDCGCVIMHMLGDDPATMQAEPRYGDVVGEVGAWLAERAAALESAGVARERIVVDPGIGFGKTLEHNLELLRGLPALASLGHPVLLGASRKRFIGTLTGVETPADRLEGSLAAALWAVTHGASIVRVHDVLATVRALSVITAIEEGPAGV